MAPNGTEWHRWENTGVRQALGSVVRGGLRPNETK